MVTSVRKALGDETSDSAQLLAMKSLSTTSLDVASHYAAAVEAQSRGKFDVALESFSKAVELDPKFGLGYQGMAVMSRNLGRLQDAEKYAKEALRYLDAMTERERFATRGNYYIRTSDYPAVRQRIRRADRPIPGRHRRAQPTRAVYVADCETCAGPSKKCGRSCGFCPTT